MDHDTVHQVVRERLRRVLVVRGREGLLELLFRPDVVLLSTELAARTEVRTRDVSKATREFGCRLTYSAASRSRSR